MFVILISTRAIIRSTIEGKIDEVSSVVEILTLNIIIFLIDIIYIQQIRKLKKNFAQLLNATHLLVLISTLNIPRSTIEGKIDEMYSVLEISMSTL